MQEQFNKVNGVVFEKIKDGKRFIKFQLDFVNKPKLFDKWEKYIKREDVTNCFINVLINIREQDIHRLDIKRLSKLLQSAFYVKPITKKITFTGPYPSESNDENNIQFFSLKPLEAINHSIELRKPSNMKRVRKIARKIIKGYDINFDELIASDRGWLFSLSDGYKVKRSKKVKKVRKVKK